MKTHVQLRRLPLGHPSVNLPRGITVFERGWLSANNILLLDDDCSVLVDSGYATHSDQTLSMVRAAIGGAPLDRLLNTHLHSDHCGGNAALQHAYPQLQTAIPPGQAAEVRIWDATALTYEPTGQICPRFTFDALLEPGQRVRMAHGDWEIHSAPGHDPHAVILFDPGSGALISGDALWENGFGVVFPELEGRDAFDQVSSTFDVIERLAPATVIPGHGKVFRNVGMALDTARRRLDSFVASPTRHGLHAAKVLIKFKLLEWQRVSHAGLLAWAVETPYFQTLHARFGDEMLPMWIDGLVDSLVAAGAAIRAGDDIVNV